VARHTSNSAVARNCVVELVGLEPTTATIPHLYPFFRNERLPEGGS